MTERHELIAQRAYRIWEEAGRPEGQDAEHWAAAEAELAVAADGEGRETGGIAPSESAALEEAAGTPSAPRGSIRSKRRT